MKLLTLDEIKQAELELLRVFDSFCRAHQIRYFLSYGTLLGAVKYKGFIPWDDDVDVLVPREDYDRLVAAFRDHDNIRLLSYEREKRYLFPFAKLCDMSIIKDEVGNNNGLRLGLSLDVFPLDAWASDPAEAVRESRRIGNAMRALGLSKLEKPNASTALKRAVQSVLIIAGRLCTPEYFLRRIIRLSCREEQRGSAYLGCKSWCIYGSREILPAEVFADTIEVEFEGSRFPAPAGFDMYLRSLYGDYHQDPPPEKQKSHHHFIAYRP